MICGLVRSKCHFLAYAERNLPTDDLPGGLRPRRRNDLLRGIVGLSKR